MDGADVRMIADALRAGRRTDRAPVSPSPSTRTLVRAVVLALASALAGCGDPSMQRLDARQANGQLLLRQFGCGDCHVIPGVADARGNVGPPLTHIAKRTYLAGRVPNRPETMAQWIRAPQRFDPMTHMPDLQVTEAHARDMAAYLFTLD